MRRDAQEQRLEALERDFRPRLIAVLRKCARGRYGLFGQNNHGELARYYVWTEADELKQTAEQISALRSEFGQPNPVSIRFQEYCSMRGQNVKGEAKLAQQFLTEIGEARATGIVFVSLTGLHFALYSCTVAAFATPAASMCPVAR
jgi:hypothetical protein